MEPTNVIQFKRLKMKRINIKNIEIVHIEEIHFRLFSENYRYLALLSATYNENAVEGSLEADDFSAANLIRETAQMIGDSIVAELSLNTIKKKLNVILRRQGISRKQRRMEGDNWIGERPIK